MDNDPRPTLLFLRLLDDECRYLDEMLFVTGKGKYFLLVRYYSKDDKCIYYLYPCDSNGEVPLKVEPIFEKKAPLSTPIDTLLRAEYKVKGIE